MTSPTTDPTTSPVLGQQPAPDTTDGVTQTSVPTEPAAAEVEEPRVSVGVYTDTEGRVHHASPWSKNTLDNLKSGAWQEGVVEPAPPFDPTGKKVSEVIAHLQAHAGDAAEIARVQAADSRPTVRDWTPSS